MRTLLACDHYRSIDYYTEAIFLAKQAQGLSPMAIQCSDYDTFQNDQCSDCGENEEKCFFISPQSIDYTIKFPNWPVVAKEKFFISTNRQKPFFV